MPLPATLIQLDEIDGGTQIAKSTIGPPVTVPGAAERSSCNVLNLSAFLASTPLEITFGFHRVRPPSCAPITSVDSGYKSRGLVEVHGSPSTR